MGKTRMEDLHPDLSGVIDEHTAQLADKAEQTDLTSGLAQKRDKTALLTMVDMGQDVKTAMTGGSVAVVGVGAVQEVNVLDKQITPRKSSYILDENNVWTDTSDITYVATQTGGWKQVSYEFTDLTIDDLYTLYIGSVFGNMDDVFAQFISYRSNGTSVDSRNFQVSTTTKSATIQVKSDVVKLKVILFASQATNITAGNSVTWSDIRLIKNGDLNYKLEDTIKISQDNIFDKSFLPSDTNFFTESCNMYDKSKYTSGYEINKNTGVPQVNSNAAYSDYIPVDSQKSYYKKYYGAITFYAKDKVFMSGAETGTEGAYYTIPQGCFYVRLNITGNTNFDNEIFCLSTADHSFLMPYDTKFLLPKYIDTRQFNGWYGKKFTSFGHSIVAMERWQKYVANYFGMYHTNCGIGGSSVAGTNGTTGNNPMWTDARINTIPSDSNLIIILAGLNDYTAGSSNMGNIDNETDTESFYGAYQTMLNKLYVRCPNARIVIMIDLFRNESSTAVQTVYEELRNATRNIAKKYNYPTIESTEFGINKFNYVSFNETGDNVHPSYVGGARMADVVIGRLKDLSPYNSTFN